MVIVIIKRAFSAFGQFLALLPAGRCSLFPLPQKRCHQQRMWRWDCFYCKWKIRCLFSGRGSNPFSSQKWLGARMRLCISVVTEAQSCQASDPITASSFLFAPSGLLNLMQRSSCHSVFNFIFIERWQKKNNIRNTCIFFSDSPTVNILPHLLYHSLSLKYLRGSRIFQGHLLLTTSCISYKGEYSLIALVQWATLVNLKFVQLLTDLQLYSSFHSWPSNGLFYTVSFFFLPLNIQPNLGPRVDSLVVVSL